MNNFNDQLSRMKAMMSYGTNDKKESHKAVEYHREGADGKMYGIVREGTKYYIKVADKSKNNVLAESYDYIGGFRNRKEYEYSSYANALKQFELKMVSVNEACGKREIMVESWNPVKKEELTLEATDRMRREIMRQRQIMSNSDVILEKKNYTVSLDEACSEKVDKDCAATQKNNIKKIKDGKGAPVGNGGDPYTEKVDAEQKATQSTNAKKEFKPVMAESEQTLAWNDNKDYLDTTHGTEIGDSAPFTEGEGTEKDMENGVVAEGNALHNTDNQNSPAVGTGEIGDDAPYTETVKEGVEDEDVMDDDFEDSDPMEDDFEDEEPLNGDEFGAEDELDGELGDEFGADEDPMVADDLVDGEGDLAAEVDVIKSMLQQIMDKLGVDAFEDDSLYGDDEEGDDVETDFDVEMDDEPSDDDFDAESDEEDFEDDEDEDVEVYESRAYRKVMSEDRLDYFGKHPAYQKKVMTLPSNKHQDKEGYYDMNDESVANERPYGQQIGDSAPFEIAPDQIENAITEAVKRVMKKKI